MWFMNKFANPFVRFILRSPLHKMMSAAVMLITYHGKKTGKAYTLPVQYVQAKEAIYIIPGMPERKTWWRNLRGGAPVVLTLNGKTLNGQALVLEAGTESAAEAFRLYLKRFPPAAKLYDIRLGPDGTCSEEDLQHAARSIVAVKIEPAL